MKTVKWKKHESHDIHEYTQEEQILEVRMKLIWSVAEQWNTGPCTGGRSKFLKV